jgi:hypothetical protein
MQAPKLSKSELRRRRKQREDAAGRKHKAVSYVSVSAEEAGGEGCFTPARIEREHVHKVYDAIAEHFRCVTALRDKSCILICFVATAVMPPGLL